MNPAGSREATAEKTDAAVLIALRDEGRAARLADACETADISTAIARQGVEALELALAQPPILVVAELGLPLLDPPRLAEILRANARTRRARFLFLGDEETLGNGGGVGDAIQPAGLLPYDLVPAIEQMLDRQARIANIDRETGQGGHGDGQLDQLSLAELLELFHLSCKTGSLELEREHPDTAVAECGVVHVRAGEVVQAQVGGVEGEKALFRLLGWRSGHFRFAAPSSNVTPSIQTPTLALLAEGLRQLAESDRQATRLPPLESQIRLQVANPELPQIDHPLTQEVLILAELYAQVGDVVDHCSFPDYQVLRTLHTLAQREIIEIVRSPLPASPREIGGLFDDAQRRRLLEWMGESRHDDAKLLVAGAGPSLAAAFANLLRGVPGFRLSPTIQSHEIGPEDLAPIGRIAIDGRRGIELMHVPTGPAQAPLWPLAAYGALGAVLLLEPPVAEAAARLQGFEAAVRRLPHSRVFNVLVVPAGDRVSADELQENLSLIDQASLFLLPQGGNKPTAPLLRSLFARIVP